MLGDREVVQLLEANGYPGRLLNSGIVWIELEVTDPQTKSVSQQRMSKSAFADLILEWRSRGVVTEMREPQWSSS